MRKDVLAEIVARKRIEVAEARAKLPLTAVRARAESQPPARPFAEALLAQARAGQTAVIAEVKRKSPSAGLLRAEYDGLSFAPENIASRYHRAGATAISCLTDGPDFGGDLSYIERIRSQIPIPVLRKDFLIDEYQVYEARAAGADAILLIAECLESERIRELHALARRLTMGVLIESHDRTNFERVVGIVGDPPGSGTLVGVNNRDLRTLAVDLARTVELAGLVKNPGYVVGESGIRRPADLETLERTGVRIVLVGEHLMRQEDPGAALAELLGGATKDSVSGGSVSV